MGERRINLRSPVGKESIAKRKRSDWEEKVIDGGKGESEKERQQKRLQLSTAQGSSQKKILTFLRGNFCGI